jgi:O-methyltransferase domain
MTNFADQLGLIDGLRRVSALFSLDKTEIRLSLKSGIDLAIVDPSTRKLIRALVRDGFLLDDEKTISWSPKWQWLSETDNWSGLMRLLRHQVGYVNLSNEFGIREHGGSSEDVDRNPEEYFAFLEGVGRSHTGHAKWFADLPVLQGKLNLCDLGGGIGVFADSWIQSATNRSCDLRDLENVVSLILSHRSFDNRISVSATDLEGNLGNLIHSEVVLLSNVLHLFADWAGCLERIIGAIPRNSVLCLLEADPTTREGSLFELQVLLRSQGRGGMIEPDELTNFFVKHFGNNHSVLTVPECGDPLARTYKLWMGVKE